MVHAGDILRSDAVFSELTRIATSAAVTNDIVGIIGLYDRSGFFDSPLSSILSSCSVLRSILFGNIINVVVSGSAGSVGRFAVMRGCPSNTVGFGFNHIVQYKVALPPEIYQ